MKSAQRAAIVAATEAYPVLLRAIEVGNRHHSLRSSSQPYEFGEDAVAGDIECEINAIGTQRPNTGAHAIAVRDCCHPKGVQQSVVRQAGSTEHTCSTSDGQLRGSGSDIPGRPVDQQRLAVDDSKQIQGPSCGLHGRRQRGGAHEIERRWDRCVTRQNGQLCLGRAVGAETKDVITNRDVCNALAEFIDDTGRFVSQRLREFSIHQTAALLPITRVHPGGVYDNPHVPWCRVRVRKLRNLEHVRTAECIETNSLHGTGLVSLMPFMPLMGST